MDIQIFPSTFSEEGRDGALRVLHLWNLANSVLRTSPSLSRHFIRQMFSTAREAHLEIHKSIQSRVCAQCGTIKVESITAKSRCVQKKRPSGNTRKATPFEEESMIGLESVGRHGEGSTEGTGGSSGVETKGKERRKKGLADNERRMKRKQREMVHAKHTQLVRKCFVCKHKESVRGFLKTKECVLIPTRAVKKAADTGEDMPLGERKKRGREEQREREKKEGDALGSRVQGKEYQSQLRRRKKRKYTSTGNGSKQPLFLSSSSPQVAYPLQCLPLSSLLAWESKHILLSSETLERFLCVCIQNTFEPIGCVWRGPSLSASSSFSSHYLRVLSSFFLFPLFPPQNSHLFLLSILHHDVQHFLIQS
eukprot:TRINITY_DN1422_c0_g1_i2.p1 TRINITY_DN1422_c0_g1~~TRINITY_DN1422_c0_g1_i2.p1  ORF type:complete len:395 (+),score=111.95 TRINITY_DN1422_c0_g1_i2:91-1185(+)